MAKDFLVDSSVFLFSPQALYAFDDNRVLIPVCVLQEMGEAARGHGESRANAVEFLQMLDTILDDRWKKGLLENGGVVEVCGSATEDIYRLAQRNDSIIVSRDPAVRVRARTFGVQAEPFKAEQVRAGAVPYSGRCVLYVSPHEMSLFAKNSELFLNREKTYYATDAEGCVLSDDYHLTCNEYVTLVNQDNPSAATLLGRFDGEKIVPLYFCRKDVPVYGVLARNAAQMFALDALMNPDAPLVILQGPAGTAKTFLSMAAALQQTLEENVYRRILVTRPNTKMDNDVGFLKGDEKDKVLPTLRGLLDNVDNLMPGADRCGKDGSDFSCPLDDLMERGIIDAQAMAYMRGRSITRQFMIVDEMQNSTPNQALSIITRIGEGSKIVLLGDPDQIDSPYLDRRSNGLVYAAEGMKGSAYCWQLTFTEKESTRSPLAKEALSRLRPKGAL